MITATEITLTREQYDAIGRLLSSQPQSKSVVAIHVETPETSETPDVRWRPVHEFVRVTFDAGWGTLAYDIDREGNSEHVSFGTSEISG